MAIEYRYPSVNPFTKRDSNIFYGRDQEVKKLLQVMRHEEIVIMHSKSGLGKTSLINASLIPALESDGTSRVFNFRFYSFRSDRDISPKDKVIRKLSKEVSERVDFLEELADGEYGFWYYLKMIQVLEDYDGSFVFIFDQFEEIFTYPDSYVRDFASELASLLYESMPSRVSYEFKRRYFEDEGFLTDKDLDQLQRPLKVRVLFSIRSDKLSLVSSLDKYFPSLLKVLFKLEPLTPIGAEKAIVKPARLKEEDFLTRPFDYSDAALDFIVEYLTKGSSDGIDSAQLQILCSNIERNVVSGQEKLMIELEDIGDLDRIYENYYSDQIGKIRDQDERIAARRLLEEGLIQEEDERRLSLYPAQILDFYGISEELLRKLIDTRLIRREPDGLGGFRYEISHDSLVKPILSAKRKRFISEERHKMAEEARKKQKKYLLNFGLAVLVCLLGLLVFLLINVNTKFRLAKDKADLEIERGKIRESVYSGFENSMKLTNYALVGSENDRTIALSLVQKALILNDSNDIAYNVRNTLALGSERFPFYQDVIFKHNDYVVDMALSRDGNKLISGTKDGKVKVWNMMGDSLYSFLGITEELFDVDCLDDGRIIASFKGRFIVLNEDGTINCQSQYIDNSRIFDVEYSAARQEFITADERGIIKTWSKVGDKAVEKSSFETNAKGIRSISLLRSDRYLVCASEEGSLMLYEFDAGTIDTLVESFGSGVMNMDYSSVRNLFAVGLFNGQVKVFGIEGDSTVVYRSSWVGHQSRVSDIVFNDGGDRLLTSSWDRSAKLWDLNGTIHKTFLGHMHGLRAVTFSEDESQIFTGGEDRNIKIWLIETQAEKSKDYAETPNAIDFSKINTFVVAFEDGRIELYDKDSDLINDASMDQGTTVNDVAMFGDGSKIISVGESGNVFLWDNTGNRIGSFDARSGIIYSVELSSDESLLVTTSEDGQAKIWKTDEAFTSVYPQSVAFEHEGVQDACLSPSQTHLVSGSLDGSVLLWDINSKDIPVRKKHEDRVGTVAFINDSLFMSGSWDNTVGIWEVFDTSSELILIGHSSDVNKVRYSAEADLILSASSDNTVRLWKTDGKEILSIISHPQSIIDAAFDPTGNLLYTIGRDQSLKSWNLEQMEDILDRLPKLDQQQLGRYGLRGLLFSQD